MSRQMRPLSSIFGWYTLVINRHLGGSMGYLSNRLRVSSSDTSDKLSQRQEVVSKTYFGGRLIEILNSPFS